MADPKSDADERQEHAEASHEARIAERARQMWEADGRPAGQEAEFRERARELLAIAENPDAGQLPNPMIADARLSPADLAGTTSLPGEDAVLPKPGGEHMIEEADIQENLGEFPGPYTDQGDRQQTPSRKRPSGGG
jgi:hypothetical protein